MCLNWYETFQVYPIGIPLLYAYILWINRDSLNPRVVEDAGGSRPDEEVVAKSASASEEPELSVEERLERRLQNPDLVPSMFLWKDFGEQAGQSRAGVRRAEPRGRRDFFLAMAKTGSTRRVPGRNRYPEDNSRRTTDRPWPHFRRGRPIQAVHPSEVYPLLAVAPLFYAHMFGRVGPGRGGVRAVRLDGGLFSSLFCLCVV